MSYNKATLTLALETPTPPKSLFFLVPFSQTSFTLCLLSPFWKMITSIVVRKAAQNIDGHSSYVSRSHKVRLRRDTGQMAPLGLAKSHPLLCHGQGPFSNFLILFHFSLQIFPLVIVYATLNLKVECPYWV